MADVPDLVRVAVVAPLSNSDKSLSAVISMAQAIQILCVSRNVFLKIQVNLITVCGVIKLEFVVLSNWSLWCYQTGVCGV